MDNLCKSTVCHYAYSDVMLGCRIVILSGKLKAWVQLFSLPIPCILPFKFFLSLSLSLSLCVCVCVCACVCACVCVSVCVCACARACVPASLRAYVLRACVVFVFTPSNVYRCPQILELFPNSKSKCCHN